MNDWEQNFHENKKMFCKLHSYKNIMIQKLNCNFSRIWKKNHCRAILWFFTTKNLGGRGWGARARTLSPFRGPGGQGAIFQVQVDEFSFRIFVRSFEVVWPQQPQKGLRIFFSKIAFLVSVRSNENDEVYYSGKDFTKSLHRGFVNSSFVHHTNNLRLGKMGIVSPF